MVLESVREVTEKDLILLNHEKYSKSVIDDSIQSVFRSLIVQCGFQEQREKIDLDQFALSIYGHKVEILHKENDIYKSIGVLSLSQKTKDANTEGSAEVVQGPFAAQVHKAIKILKEHAYTLGLYNEDRICKDIKEPSKITKTPSKPLSEKVQTIGYPVADSIGVVRNAMDLVKLLSFLGFICSFFAENEAKIADSIAGLRIIQGMLSIVLGIIKYKQNLTLYREAEDNHDVEGMEIYKKQMQNAAVVILEGILWILIGSVYFLMPPVGLTMTILQWGLFYGAFAVDSVQSIFISNEIIAHLEKHYQFFKDGVLNNKNLSDEEKGIASIRFLESLLFVTPQEEDKIRENNPGASEELILKRLAQKQAKKRMIAERMGFTLEMYHKVKKQPEQAFAEIQLKFNEKIAAQKAARNLAIFCLLVNISSLPLDLPFMAAVLNIFVGVNLNWFNSLITNDKEAMQLWAINDFWWVVVNGAYLSEDYGKITEMLKKCSKLQFIGKMKESYEEWQKKIDAAKTESLNSMFSAMAYSHR